MDFQTAQMIQGLAFFSFCSVLAICITWYKIQKAKIAASHMNCDASRSS